ncbi:MAG: hypothetical protein QM788_17480 [Roseateles sp.]|uniref:hypothetical protein n=1 Tax=Roseateles sp. TaxID=1971397 RepID=UPI0039EC759F
MKFQSQIKVVGMKASKGQMDNGVSFDSTKVYALVDMDSSKGNAFGQCSAEFTLGLSDEIKKFEKMPFPFDAIAEMEIVTNGKTSKTVMHGLKPVAAKAA